MRGHRRHLDAAHDASINGVTLPSGEVVPWAIAFPRRVEPVTVTVECDCQACSGEQVAA